MLLAHQISPTRTPCSSDLRADISESLPRFTFFREPAKRQRELRAFIAKQRRQAKQIESENRNRGSDAGDVKSDDDHGEDDDDDTPILTAAPAPPLSAPPALRFSPDPRPASSEEPTSLPDEVLLGARRLCFEVDEESKGSGGGVLTGGPVERIMNDVVSAGTGKEDRSADSSDYPSTKEVKQGDGRDEEASKPHFERRWGVDHAVSSSRQKSPSEDRVVVEPFVAEEAQEVIRSARTD